MQLVIDPVQLLELAARALEETVLPTAEGQSRYAALMVRNVLGMVARELSGQERLDDATEELITAAACSGSGAATKVTDLVRALRAGDFDADPRMHHALWAHAAQLTSVTKPSALSRIESQMVGDADLHSASRP